MNENDENDERNREKELTSLFVHWRELAATNSRNLLPLKNSTRLSEAIPSRSSRRPEKREEKKREDDEHESNAK
jgi:hypothetical protein